MKRRSWVILAVCVCLAALLIFAFLVSQRGPDQLTEQGAINITRNMEAAFHNKNANGVLAYISPERDTRITSVTVDQLHLLLVRYFRSAGSVSADLNNYVFSAGDPESALQFDLIVHSDTSDSRAEDYKGHITVHFRRVDIPHLLGLYHTREWRISSVETTGADLSTFGD